MKQFIITSKKSFKKSYFSLKPGLKSSYLMPDIGQVCRRPVLHALDLPPFQNNISSACSYFPE